MKISIALFVALFLTFGCVGQTDRQQARHTENLVQEANSKVGFPRITNFREKQLAKQIYEARDRANYLTYTYIVDFNGRYIYLCDSIGYGLPYSVQYSNPENYFTNDPQPEPNGLFMPEGLSATWVQCINPETGSPESQYVEPQIMVFTYKLDN